MPMAQFMAQSATLQLSHPVKTVSLGSIQAGGRGSKKTARQVHVFGH